MASVEIKNVTKIYDNEAKAVDNVSLKIEDSEFVVLVGPSGCGKSTLLRMIAGLEEISEGTISIAGTIVNKIPAKDRNIAMVFQNYALYPHMTVYENMAFGLKLRKFQKQEIIQRVNEAAEILDLKEYLKRKPRQLSGGQRQRVAVGRAIVRKPDVFLFDEPLSNLDAKLRVQMRLEISKLHKELKTTMIYVTHDQVEAMTMGDRIVVVNKGQVQQYDTPLNVYNSPANRFVAGFIGSPAMNFIEGEVKGRETLSFSMDGFSLPLSSGLSNEIRLKKIERLIMGIRPEHFKISPTEKSSIHTINASVELVEPMGNELFVYLKTEQTKLTMRCDPDQKIKLGDMISLSIEQDKCHFFDFETGIKIKNQ